MGFKSSEEGPRRRNVEATIDLVAAAARRCLLKAVGETSSSSEATSLLKHGRVRHDLKEWPAHRRPSVADAVDGRVRPARRRHELVQRAARRRDETLQQ